MKRIIFSLLTVFMLVVMTLPAAPVIANNVQYELEGYTLVPHEKWTTGNIKGWAEGDCIPFRYTVENNGGDPVSLNLTLEFDHKIDGTVGIVDFEDFIIPGGNITGPTLDGSGFYYWDVTVPAETIYVLEWCSRLSNEAGLWPGSSLHVRAGGKDVPISVGEIKMPDLCATKGANVTCDAISYTISYGNNGEADQTSTVLFDDYDETKVEVTDDGGGTDNGDTITWNIGTLAAGATGSKSYTVSIKEGVANGAAIVNTGNITGDLAEDDYTDNTYSVTVNAKVSPTASITPDPAAVELGVDQQLHGNPAGGSGTYTIHSWTGSGVTYLSSTTIENPVFNSNTAGIYSLTYTVTDANGCVGSDDVMITVTKRALEITADSDSKVYDGTPLTDSGYSITSGTLAAGDTLDSVTVSGSQTEVGSSPNVPSTAVIKDAGEVDVTASYNITYVNGTLTVTAPPTPPRGGGGGCPTTKYLTVDWEGNNTTEPLYSNDKLAVALLGPSLDLSHSLFLEVGTHAPVVGGMTHYLIVVRELEETPTLPENTEAIVVFNITPIGAVFDKNIFLTLGIEELPEDALSVTMAYYDDVSGTWENLDYEAGGPPNSVAELSLSAPINHFSIFGVLAELEPSTPPSPANFVGSGLNIVTSVETGIFVTKTGESVTIAANVVNDGGQEGTYTVELKLDGETVDTEIVTLGAGQSQPVSFTLSGLDYGQHEVEIVGLSDEFTTSRTITWWLIILIIVAVGLIIWGVIWGRRRRRAAQGG